MDSSEMTAAVLCIVDDDRAADSVELVYLPMAKSAVVSRLFPFDESKKWDDVPERHHMATCEIAAYLFSRRGAEGEKSHTENGVTHTWGSSLVPEAMFAGMVPMAGSIVSKGSGNAVDGA